MSYLRYYPQGSGTPELLAFDVVPSEDEAHTAEVTKYPVEKGADVTDHVRPKPQTIKFEGIISNASIASSGTVSPQFDAHASPRPAMYSRAAPSSARPGDDARRSLTEIANAGRTVDLYLGPEDSGRLYQNLALASVNFPRDAKTGDALRFSASFEEVRIVSSRTVDIPKTKIPRAQGQVNRGKQATKAASDAESDDAYTTLGRWTKPNGGTDILGNVVH